MSTSTLAQRERRELADLLDAVGPHAPTLCEGWDTHDMAAHLWIRESDPIGMPGILLPPLSGVTDARMQTLQQDLPYAELVDRVRRGPGRFSIFRPLDEAANTLEYFIHHEDVRRGAEDGTAPRDLSIDDQAEILRRLAAMASQMLRPRGVQIELVPAGTTDAKVFGDSRGLVRVTGDPAELALIAFGRGRAAFARVAGSDRDIQLLADQGIDLPAPN